MITDCQVCRIGGYRIYDHLKHNRQFVNRNNINLDGAAGQYQNAKYGHGRRVHNLTPKTQSSKGNRVCTVCGTRTAL